MQPASLPRLLQQGLLLLALVLVGFGDAQAQERRVALVVGANAYRAITPLQNAVADARAVAERLRGLGFEVVGPVLDPTRAQFDTALDRFEGALQGAALGLFFYAGHAVEVGGKNLLLPIDAPAATSERQLRSNAIDAQEILAAVLARAPRAVMILDACRDNPLPRDAARGNRPSVGGTRGLEPIEAPRRADGGSFVVLAAAPGEVALDRLPGTDRDPNGLFTRHLLRALDNPARPLPVLMGEVRDAVAAAAQGANRRQVPELTDRMVGSGGLLLASMPAAGRPAAPQASPDMLDLTFWQSVQGSRNVADFEAYLAAFPQGRFAALARNRLAELRPQAALPVPAPPAFSALPATPRPASSGYPVGVGQSFRDCGDCPEMVVIPAGRFGMGSPQNEPGRESAEGPQREVSVSRPLAVGKFEVTFAEWDACVSAGGCSHRPDEAGWGRGRQPAMRVSWDDAQGYLRWLSQRTGRTYRLLTEAEWEYAARAGASAAYAFGPTISPSQANYFESRLNRTQPVGSYGANRFGLHDMQGNVWEWVQDCWRDNYAGAPSDAGQAVEGGSCAARVLRGGSWNSTPLDLRSAYRFRYTPGFRSGDFGFRVARTPG